MARPGFGHAQPLQFVDDTTDFLCARVAQVEPAQNKAGSAAEFLRDSAGDVEDAGMGAARENHHAAPRSDDQRLLLDPPAQHARAVYVPANLLRLANLDDRRSSLAHQVLDSRRKRCRKIDTHARISIQQPSQPACMIPMSMGENDHIDARRIDLQLRHVLQQEGPVAARVEEDASLGPCDVRGESPGGLERFDTRIVVVNDSDRQLTQRHVFV